MIKFQKACKVCAIIKEEGLRKGSLGRRIYDSGYYIPGGEPLAEIVRDYEDKISYPSIRNHAKKHQALSERDLKDKAIARVSREIQVDQIKQGQKYKEMQATIIEQVLERLEAGEMKLSVRDGLAAAKQISDKEDKQIDQQQDMLKMVALFASGELSAGQNPEQTQQIEGEIVEPNSSDIDPAALFAAGHDQG